MSVSVVVIAGMRVVMVMEVAVWEVMAHVEVAWTLRVIVGAWC